MKGDGWDETVVEVYRGRPGGPLRFAHGDEQSYDPSPDMIWAGPIPVPELPGLTTEQVDAARDAFESGRVPYVKQDVD